METNVRAIQLKCLEILDIVDQICRNNNIQYSLCGGSVVGAHLYQGCLPWDDDIDIMMTRDNYNRFLQLAPALLPEGYALHNYRLDPDFNKGISKVMNERTTYVEDNGLVEGIFLDITVYDRVPVSAIPRWIDMFLCRRSLTVMRGKLPGGGLKNRLRSLLLDTLWADRRRFLMRFQRVVEFLGRRASRYTYSELFGAWAQTVAYRPSVFEHYTTIAFEGKQYMIVRDYVEYLQTRYQRTDFREPKEKQVAPHIAFVDFNLPYREYLKTHPRK